MAKLKEGGKAPSFSLQDKDGEVRKLGEGNFDYTVVYFYPKDNTPGCTIEAQEFSKQIKKFEKAGAAVIGISGGDEKSKIKFCTKHKLKVTLLSDPDFKVASKYGAYGPKTFMGKKFKGINRMTFVLNRHKKVLKIYDKVKAAGHAEEVLNFIKEL
jgi:thioredoxin-dependent peroxiredoxin